ncbi:MAG: replication factor C large subunit [Thermoprotei archaeon]|nr:MAG: replication factor C large subunit [Thermoprotei archaeon]
MSIPWVEKYRPKTLKDLIDQEEAKKKLISWLESWSRGKPTKKAVLLYGPPGSGKTAIVHAAANDFDLEVIEVNASDFRTATALERTIARTIRERSLFGKRGRLALLDEVDGLSLHQDVGAIDAIIRIVENSRIPIIMTANNPWDPRFRDLRNISLLIEMKKLNQRDVITVLKRICLKERIKVDTNVLRIIARRSRGDLRAAINDLQAIGEGRRSIRVEDLDVLIPRAAQINMFEIVRTVLTAKTPEQAKSVLALPSLDYQMLFHWINENLPYQYSESIEALAAAYDALSKADMYFGRINRTQNWSLLPYALELMTAGVAVVPGKPRFRFVKYSFPQKLKMLSRMRELRMVRDSILSIIARKCHVSRAVANTEILPYIKIIYKENPEYGRKILKWLGIDEKRFKSLS